MVQRIKGHTLYLEWSVGLKMGKDVSWTYTVVDRSKNDSQLALHSLYSNLTPLKDISIDSLLPSSTSRAGLTGLTNLGNTCFMNTIIQCLSNTAPLAKYLLTNSYKEHINIESKYGTKGQLIRAFADLITQLYKTQKEFVAPYKVKE
jgi:ubiquitin carboxyl-terminal hydrolase 4/11